MINNTVQNEIWKNAFKKLNRLRDTYTISAENIITVKCNCSPTVLQKKKKIILVDKFFFSVCDHLSIFFLSA